MLQYGEYADRNQDSAKQCSGIERETIILVGKFTACYILCNSTYGTNYAQVASEFRCLEMCTSTQWPR